MIAENLEKLENDIRDSYSKLEEVGINGLPKEYQKVEYIESTGTQYIDTEYKPNSKNTHSLKYQLTRMSNTLDNK